MIKTRKPCESAPPGKWIRSRTGRYAKLVRTSKTAGGCWLYRLHYEDGLLGDGLWTVDSLDTVGVRWLRRRPAAWGVM